MNTWRNILVSPEDSILHAIETINQGSKQMALVVDKAGRLLGTLTDGDIRRAILLSKPLDAPASEVMHTNFISAKIHDSEEAVLKLMRDHELRHIPLLDDEGHLIELKVLLELIKKPPLPSWVVIMAGGLGTRLRPLTDTCPKPMLEVGGRPVLEIILASVKSYGLNDVIISLNYKGDMIEEYFGDGHQIGMNITYIRESQPLGTAGALSLLPQIPEHPFLVMNGDLLTNVNFTQLLQFHKEQKVAATIALREHEIEIPYGVARTKGHRLLDLEEKPRQRHLVNAGIYVFQPDTLDILSSNKRLDMPDFFQKLIQNGREVAAFPLHEYWLDIGRHCDLDRAQWEYEDNSNHVDSTEGEG